MSSIEQLRTDRNRLIVVHYASTSIFNDAVVTHIAVRDFNSGHTHSFGRASYPDERTILEEWGNHVRGLTGSTFVGWNFHSQTYRIQALEARWRANSIPGKFPISTSDVVDLDTVLEQTYGDNYIARGPEKLKRLSDLNGVNTTNWVAGRDEPSLFDRREYRRILLSTERKVGMITHLLYLALERKLVTSPKAKRNREISSAAAIALGIALVAGIYAGSFHLSDVSSAIAAFLVGGILTILGWGWGIKVMITRRFGSD